MIISLEGKEPKLVSQTSFISWESLAKLYEKEAGWDKKKIITVVVKENGLNFVWG